MSIAIRAAQPYDADAIARLLTQLGYASNGTEVGRRLAYWSGDPVSRVLVAVRDGAVAGCLAVHASPYLERTGRWARITSLVVDETARGDGIGRALVNAAEEFAKEWDCLAIEVTSSRTRKAAHAFYRDLGFTDVSSRSGRFLKELG